VWEAVKKEISLTGFPEPRKELNCLYFDKRSKNVALGWEMGDRTLSQVFTEGWQRQKGTFDLLRRNSYNNRALSIVTMQSSKVFVAILTGMNAYTMSMNVEGIVALERENDVVLVEPR
ncbi:MAG: hypothetical protein K6T35_09015, partial [Meiothermus silvanus]|nr:hypothetical protein [Allomeiothermus silvanus]